MANLKFKRIFRGAVAVLAFGVMLFRFEPTAQSESKGSRGPRLYFTSNRQGEIEPCGCQVHQIGGLSRILFYLKKEGARSSVFVDAGDTFFSSFPLNERRRASEMARARVIAKAYNLFPVAAFSPGERDFAAGIDYLKELRQISGAAFVASNLTDKDGNLVFQRYQIISRDGVVFGIFSLASVESFSAVKEVLVTPPEKVGAAVVKELREQGVSKVILLSHLGLELDRKIAAEIPGIDLIVGSHSLDILAKPEWVGKTAIVQPQNEGQQLGVVDFASAGDKPLTSRLFDLEKNLDGKNAVTKLADDYREEIRNLALEESKKALPASAERPFVANPETCRDCHQKQYDWWAKTKHSSAYLVLYAKNQHFDPECISCHSLGFQSPGGFQKIAQPFVLSGLPGGYEADPKRPFVEQLMQKVFANDAGKGAAKPLDSRVEPKRYAALKKRYHAEVKRLNADEKIEKIYIGVQCEHCHGNRNGHPDPNVPTVKKVSETSCRTCHAPPNAPNFDPKLIRTIGCPLSNAR